MRPTVQTIELTLNIAGDTAGMKKWCSALAIPMNAAASATNVRNGSMMRVSVTVSSSLPGTSSKPPANVRTSGSVNTRPSTTAMPVITSSALTT